MMPDAREHQLLSDASLRNLNVTLAEYVVHFRKADGNPIATSMRSAYLDSINRWLKESWKLNVNILTDPVFNEDRDGYMHVANKISAEAQAKGDRIRPYNTLTDNDIETILSHDITSPKHASGYVNRSIVIMGLLIGCRPTALRTLKWEMFHDEFDFNGKPCIRYQGIIGCFEGSSKTEKGGLKKAKKIPTSVTFFDEDLLYDINPYKFIKEHRENCIKVGPLSNFFLAPNNNRNAKHILKNAPVGENSFSF